MISCYSSSFLFAIPTGLLLLLVEDFLFWVVSRISFCRFGADVMDTVAVWTKNLCNIIPGGIPPGSDTVNYEADENVLYNYPVLDIGTGNGLLLQALAKLGYYLIYLHIVLK